MFVFIVITLDGTGTVVDTEVLSSKPRWDGDNLPQGHRQIVRSGYVDGGDTTLVRTIDGTCPV